MARYEDQETTTAHEFARAVQGAGGGGLDHLFSLGDYFRNIGRHWRLFVIAIVIGSVWALYYETHTPKQYTVTVYIGPVGDTGPQGTGGVSGLVSLFMSGGSMAVGPPDWSRYVFALTSVKLAEKVEREHHVIKQLYISRWDAKHHRWKPTPGIRGSIARFFDKLFGRPVDPPPDIQSLKGYISSKVKLSTDKTTGITTLNMTDSDPRKALDFVLMIHDTAVAMVREDIAAKNVAKIDYLTGALSKTNNADQRSVLITMLAQTEQTQMLLNNNLPFAAQIIDTPVVPVQPSTPQVIQVALIYRIGFLIFLTLMMIAIDQMASTNFATYIEAKIVNIPRSLGLRISRFREYGWRGVFSRTEA
ncbi:MAG: hypothetical protein ACTHLR_15645 [Rhizomicrobium sp.]